MEKSRPSIPTYCPLCKRFGRGSDIPLEVVRSTYGHHFVKLTLKCSNREHGKCNYKCCKQVI